MRDSYKATKRYKNGSFDDKIIFAIMPRNYTSESLEAAINSINDGVSYREASTMYGVLLGTLYNKVKGRHQGKVGKNNALNEDIEERLTVMLKFLTHWKLPLRVNEFLELVKEVLDRNNQVITSFKENKPSRKWLANFLVRQNLRPLC